jgi:hypothetical protein
LLLRWLILPSPTVGRILEKQIYLAGSGLMNGHLICELFV